MRLVAKEALKKNPRIGPKSRRIVCDPTGFAVDAFSPPLPPRPVDAATARAPRRCSTHPCASSFRRKRSNCRCKCREFLGGTAPLRQNWETCCLWERQCISSHLQPSPAQAEGNGLRSARTCCNCKAIQRVVREQRFTQRRHVIPAVPLRHRDLQLERTLPFCHHHVIRTMAVQIQLDERQQREVQPNSIEIGRRLDLVVEAGQQCSNVGTQHWQVRADH